MAESGEQEAYFFEITKKNIKKFNDAANSFIDKEKKKNDRQCYEKHQEDIDAFASCRKEKWRNLKYHSEFFFIKKSFEEINAQKCFMEILRNEQRLPRGEIQKMFKICTEEMEANLVKHIKDFTRKFE